MNQQTISIYDQKKQMIMKSGILEMITVKEKIGDIGEGRAVEVWAICLLETEN